MALENDLVLIYHENNPMVFARIESITADHKKDWYQVRLLILGIPLQVVTWILKDVYIDGAEFTMEGRKMRLEKVVCPPDSPPPPADRAGHDEGPGKSGARKKARVIAFPEKK